MTATLIWLACIQTAWPLFLDPADSAGGVADGYHTEVAGILQHDVATNQYVACVPQKYTLTALRVQGFNASSTSPWSNPLMLVRVHRFTRPGRTVTGFPEFGAFVGAFNTDDAANDANGDGLVTFGDFGRFFDAFGCRYLESGLVEGC